jgi:hypothetical protein
MKPKRSLARETPSMRRSVSQKILPWNYGAEEAKCAEVEKESCVPLVRIEVEVIDAAGIESAEAPDQAVHLIAFGEQKLGEIGTVLASDPGKECYFHLCP